MIGAQSFGGGPATLQLISREMVVRRGWLTEMEYVHFWTLSTLVPGINLLAFTMLIGRKLAGGRGMFATLFGLLLPSVTITVLLTAGFVAIRQWSSFQAMLHGLIPATAGLMFVVVLNMGRPLLKESLRLGRANLSLALVFIAATAIMIGLLRWPVWLALLLALLAGPLLSSPRFATYPSVEKPPSEQALAEEKPEDGR
jgi:chromate transporter